MEEEIRGILRNAAREEKRAVSNPGSRIASRFAKARLSEELAELRGLSPRVDEFAK